MFHPAVVAWRLEQLEGEFSVPGGFRRYTVDDVQFMRSRLDQVVDERGKHTRTLTNDEQTFIANELVMTKADFEYCATRYAMVNRGGTTLGPLYPLWESQRLIIERLGAIEYRHWKDGHPDGILINCLKSRQLGCSTLAECIVAHRCTTHTNTFSLIASDVPESSAKLFAMFERYVENLPWYLRPTLSDNVKNTEIGFATNDSHMWVGSGKSTRGTEGKRGQLGRGGTYSTLHLTELSTWEDASQIDGALLPAVPISPRTIFINESTAKGRKNWWHEHWLLTKKGSGRFVNIFIPWYAEVSKNWLPAPIGWTPNATSTAHAARVEAVSHTWMGHTVHLTREQLYWYETTRDTYERKDDLATFLEEQAEDDESCFQHSGKTVFTLAVQERIRQHMRPILSVVDVQPRREIQRQTEADRGGQIGDVALPKGYGFRVLPPRELAGLDGGYEGYLLIWQLPRRGHRYVMGVDVSDGIGQDRSVCDVTRVGTLEEPDEQVAQFVSRYTDPVDLAYIADAIGRFYCDEDKYEALAAVETNNHGLATQAEMLNHCGYHHHFVWRHEDTAPGKSPLTTRIGWYTSSRTRPLILTRWARAVKGVDEATGLPEYRINSPFTLEEMRDLVIPPGESIGMAEAGPGATDDTVMAGAIGIHVVWTLHDQEDEPMSDRRARLAEERQRASLLATNLSTKRDYQNTDCSADEMDGKDDYDGWEGAPDYAH